MTDLPRVKVRGGTRGGRDQFSWESVKADKAHRAHYLGATIMAPVQKGKDIFWYNKASADTNTVPTVVASTATFDGKVGDRRTLMAQFAAERAVIKAQEEQQRLAALGIKSATQSFVKSKPGTSSRGDAEPAPSVAVKLEHPLQHSEIGATSGDRAHSDHRDRGSEHDKHSERRHRDRRGRSRSRSPARHRSRSRSPLRHSHRHQRSDDRDSHRLRSRSLSPRREERRSHDSHRRDFSLRSSRSDHR